MIVGFPGEHDRHFDALRAVVSALPLSYVHVFPYSDRPGTAASHLRPKVAGTVIRERGAAMRAIGAAKVQAFRQAQVGTRRRALTVDDGRSAVTDNYLKVSLGERHPRNKWVPVVIDGSTN